MSKEEVVSIIREQPSQDYGSTQYWTNPNGYSLGCKFDDEGKLKFIRVTDETAEIVMEKGHHEGL